MSARIILGCDAHLGLLMCDDDEAFNAETVTAARALWAAKHAGAEDSKVGQVIITCEVNGCITQVIVRADSVTQARVMVSVHNLGWYLARRAGGRLVDGCQWHLGTCCVHHARYADGDTRPTLDPAAVLPGEPGYPGNENKSAQLDLFALEAS